MLTQQSAETEGAGSALTWSPRRAAGCGLLAAAAAAVLLLWVDPLDEVIGAFGHLDLSWVGAAVAVELASCASYASLFCRLFEPASPRSRAKLAWIGLGAGAVLPGGDVASIATSCVALHRDGAPKRWLVVRSSALLLLINGACVSLTGLAGALLLTGVVAGPHDLLRAGVPVLISGGILVVVAAVPSAMRRLGDGVPAWVLAVGEAVGEAGRLLRQPDRRLLGAIGYPLLDMGALWAAGQASGHAPGFAALVVAYNIGYLVSVVPVPAGIGVLDGGLAAALILYGASPSAAVTAVLVYHTFDIWIPLLCGLAASLSLPPDHRSRPGVRRRFSPLCFLSQVPASPRLALSGGHQSARTMTRVADHPSPRRRRASSHIDTSGDAR